MDDYKKYKLKQWLKSKRPFLIGTGLFLFVGIIAFFVGMAASGVNIIEMLTQPYAVTIYILIIIFLLICVALFYVYYVGKKK